jgi:4-hydroxy-tetrahydrodipicolinate synthase
VPVLIGTGGTNARETIELSQHAQQTGADGIVVINPYYWKVSEPNLIHYFQQVADSVTLPVLLYNFPALTGQDLTPALVKTRRLAQQYCRHQRHHRLGGSSAQHD